MDDTPTPDVSDDRPMPAGAFDGGDTPTTTHSIRTAALGTLGKFALISFISLLVYYDYLLLRPYFDSVAWALLVAITLTQSRDAAREYILEIDRKASIGAVSNVLRSGLSTRKKKGADPPSHSVSTPCYHAHTRQ